MNLFCKKLETISFLLATIIHMKLIHSLTASFKFSLPSIKLAWKTAPALVLLVVVLTVFSAILPVAVAYVGKALIDAVVAQNIEHSVQFVLIEGALVVFMNGVNKGYTAIQQLLGVKLGYHVNTIILEKAVTLDLQQFENPEIYDQLVKARRNASIRPASMVNDSLNVMKHSITFFSYIGVLATYSEWIVLGLMVAAIPGTISEMKFSNLGFRLRNWRSQDNRKLNYLEVVLSNDQHAKEVKILGLSDLFLYRYKALATKFYKEDKQLAVKKSVWGYILAQLSTASFYACYVFLAISAALGTISLGMLTFYLAAFRQGQGGFQNALTSLGSMYENNLYMSNLFDFLSIETSKSISAPESPIVHFKEKGIRFEKVGFHYRDKSQWALRDISVFVPAGEKLALVGHNGAGKSTFIKLVCRLYTPTEGAIYLDGINLQDWEYASLSKRLGIVFQDFNQYQFSVRQNVGLGNVEFMNDEDCLQNAIKNGGAEAVLDQLTFGLDTQLGRWFDDGEELSGGQWQKIALSRGFMRKNAEILILDEPTAALDAQSEQDVFERFTKLTKGKTSIVISHRFPTVRMADRILVIDKGRIVEQGSHNDLLKQKGVYAHLFKLQAKGYE